MSAWHFRDLVVDHVTGRLRETAVWSNIGKLVLTGGFIWQCYKGSLTEWYMVAYGTAVIFHELAARHFNQRQQQLDKQNAEPTRTV